MTYDKFIDWLWDRVERAGASTLAGELGLSPAYLDDLLYERRRPPKALLKRLGLPSLTEAPPVGRDALGRFTRPGGPPGAAPGPIRCDCGQPVTVTMQLQVNQKLVTFHLCDACAQLEKS